LSPRFTTPLSSFTSQLSDFSSKHNFDLRSSAESARTKACSGAQSLRSSAQTVRSGAHSLRRPTVKQLGVTAAAAAATAGIAAGMAASPAATMTHPSAQSTQAARTASHTQQGTALSLKGGTAPAHATTSAKLAVKAHPAHTAKLADHTSKAAGHSAGHSKASKPAIHWHATKHAAKHVTVHPAPTRPYLIYDSVTPSSIPVHQVAAAYATGKFAASASDLAGHDQVLWIDTTGYDSRANALDVEPGDATPSMAASWAWHRLHDDPKALARIYTMRSEWPAVQDAVGHLPERMQSQIRWWIADPTGVPHVVPGAAATQWYWGSHYDITTATPRFS
jgi:hypothetical protein